MKTPTQTHPSPTATGAEISRTTTLHDPLEQNKVQALRAASVKDIEHVGVENDPRLWTAAKKNWTFSVITFSGMCGALAGNIYFPAINDLKTDLGASEQQLALSVSLFILFQGVVPIAWSAISEIKGRKIVYTVSNIIFLIGTVVCSRAQNIQLFIGMRVLQASGSSAVMAIGAGTLADIYEPEERGFRLGLYYTSPLLGPTIGSLLGGVLTASSNWRATFYFLIGYGLISTVGFFFLPETFRRERSLAWRAAHHRAQIHAEALEKSLANQKQSDTAPQIAGENPSPNLEMAKVVTADGVEVKLSKVKIHFSDINPLAASKEVLKVPKNTLAIVLSASLFAAQWSLSYTCAKDLGKPPYSYGSLKVGLVIFALGLGCVIGSILGGRYSDRMLTKRKSQNNGIMSPEDRLRSVPFAMIATPCAFIMYGFLVGYGQHVSSVVIALFLVGFSLIWQYSSVLAYLVDSNPGKATSAVACNSAVRGIFALVSSEIATPLEGAIGNGPLYTIWAVIIALASAAMLWTAFRVSKVLIVPDEEQAQSEPETKEGKKGRSSKLEV